MLPAPLELVQQITEMHRDTVARWHEQPPDNPYDGLLATACQQHQFNFLLWHEEDIARSPDVSDRRIAAVKRSIDRYNQQRNDWIEKIDEALLQLLAAEGVLARADARLNTETPGSASRSPLGHGLANLSLSGTAHARRRRRNPPRLRPRTADSMPSTTRGPFAIAGRTAGRHLGRPQATQSLSPNEDVQRPDPQPVPVPLPPPGWLGHARSVAITARCTRFTQNAELPAGCCK